MYLTGVGPRRKELLDKELGIRTYRDLLEYYPYKYVDRSKIYLLSEISHDMPFVQIKGRILSFEEFEMGKRKKRIVAHFSDGHGMCELVWFNGAQYIYKNYIIGKEYIVFGKPGVYGGRIQFTHPDIDDASQIQLDNMGMQPFYVTTEKMKKAGITSRAIEKMTKTLIAKLAEPLSETIPEFIIRPLRLMSRDEAMRKIHYPKSAEDTQRARLRLKFEELFYVQLNILRYANDNRRKYRGYNLKRIGTQFNWFYSHNLSFELTGAQKRVMHEIRKDMASGRQMNRLLQGDVGSGKTLVALMAMLIAIDNGFQACLMAPTEILAEQHLQTVKEFLQGMNVRIELLTGIVKGKKRRDVLDSLANGTANILIGTHAIIEDNVRFHNLGLAVVDEQHRFGVAQRAKLWNKNDNPPHVLIM
ncbi:MAG: DEAD/DEAH box helicase, partial [Prevotella micans]|nr:DEAD/DEAH box helicase [Prevotella micans]